jgi:hypothetical protein
VKLSPSWLMPYAPPALHFGVNAHASLIDVQAWLSSCQSPRSYKPEQFTGG